MTTDSDLRRSAAGVPFLPVGPGIVPGADPPALRQQAAWGYSGILATPPSTEVVTDVTIKYARRGKPRMRARKLTVPA